MKQEIKDIDIPTKMKSYVCGFYFDDTLSRVVLIWKNKPKWQEGKLNGVGGKIEKDENPYDAMRREFKEETGIDHKDWVYFISLSGYDWHVSFFYAIGKFNEFEYAETQEEEEVAKIDIDTLDSFDYIPNLKWLIPMAIYHAENSDDIISIQRPEYQQ